MADEPVPPRPMLHKLLALLQTAQSPEQCGWLTFPCLCFAGAILPVCLLRLNCRIPCHLFACHWIRIASIVLCFVLQRTLTNENNGGTEWRGIQQLLPLRAPVVCCTLSLLVIYVLRVQTPGLCSAISLAPVKFVARLSCILLYLVIFALCVLPHKHLLCAVLFPRLP